MSPRGPWAFTRGNAVRCGAVPTLEWWCTIGEGALPPKAPLASRPPWLQGPPGFKAPLASRPPWFLGPPGFKEGPPGFKAPLADRPSADHALAARATILAAPGAPPAKQPLALEA